jgi:hypothetical protein
VLDCALAASSEAARNCSVLVPGGPMFDLLEKFKNDPDAAAKFENETMLGGGRRPKRVPKRVGDESRVQVFFFR